MPFGALLKLQFCIAKTKCVAVHEQALLLSHSSMLKVRSLAVSHILCIAGFERKAREVQKHFELGSKGAGSKPPRSLERVQDDLILKKHVEPQPTSQAD